MIEVHYNSKEDILETIWVGDIRLDEIVQYISFSEFDESHQGKLRILTDCRNARFLIDPDDLPKVAEAAKEITKYHLEIFDALVVANPLDTALSYLYEKLGPVENYNVKIFSTMENARLWLNAQK